MALIEHCGAKVSHDTNEWYNGGDEVICDVWVWYMMDWYNNSGM